MIEHSTWIEDSVSVFPADEFEVVSPDQLEDDPVGALIGDALLLVLLQLVVDQSRREASCGQPGTELGGIIL
jgi:hypothetical protein